MTRRQTMSTRFGIAPSTNTIWNLHEDSPHVPLALLTDDPNTIFDKTKFNSDFMSFLPSCQVWSRMRLRYEVTARDRPWQHHSPSVILGDWPTCLSRLSCRLRRRKKSEIIVQNAILRICGFFLRCFFRIDVNDRRKLLNQKVLKWVYVSKCIVVRVLACAEIV